MHNTSNLEADGQQQNTPRVPLLSDKNWGYNSHGLTKLDYRWLEKHCLVWWGL